MPNVIFQMDSSQVLVDLEARVRKLESTNYNVVAGNTLQFLGSANGVASTPAGGCSTSWTPLPAAQGNLGFTLTSNDQRITTRTILLLGHLDFAASGVVNSFTIYTRLGVAGSYGGAYVTPNSGFNPSDVNDTPCSASVNFTCSGTFWAVMNLNLGSYNAYFQYYMDSGSTTTIGVFGTPNIAAFAFG